ncbi:hypothetical protein D770_11695 [Flammeovirgaceae bacterium 311]|nr:hypothetical protein D770_11695 [Flammeovirgaceae bacterium 311]
MHFIVPGLLAWFFFRPMWQRAWFLMILTMLVDLDHLLSTPIFDPERCSIGHHPLHTLPAIIGYLVLLLLPHRTIRILALGLLFHMLTDFIDCLWMLKDCPECCEKSAISWVCSFL